MSNFLLENNVTQELLTCRGCLSTHVNLYSIHQQQFKEVFAYLAGTQVICDNMPQLLCAICSTLLKKFVKFKERCQRVSNLLEDLSVQNKLITTDYLSTLDLEKYNLKPVYTQTDVKTVAYFDEIKPLDFNIELNEEFNTDIVENNDGGDVKDEYIPAFNAVNIKIENRVLEPNELEVIHSESIEKIDRNIKKTKGTKHKINKVKSNKKGKHFETKENIADFENNYEVDIFILTKEQQLQDVLDRKIGFNYMHSPYRCEECFKGFIDEDNLNRHVLAQHDPSRGSVICEFCHFRYKDKRGLTQHLKSHRLKFTCRQCKYVSRTTFNAKEHFKMHGGQMYECKHCGKSYGKLSSHLTHMRIHHPSELIWCEMCGEPCVGEFGLNGHKKRAHRDLKFPPECECKRCGVQFTNADAFKRRDLSCDKTRDSVASCVHCGEQFNNRIMLKDHLLEKHRTLKKYPCEKCNKTFSKESLYSAHYRRMHVDCRQSQPKLKPWVCEICGKTLPNKCLLVYHQRNHTGERPYQCSECTKSFTMRKLLQSHMRVHTSDRPYACKMCPKTFKGLSALRAHEHVHTGDKVKPTRRRVQI